MDSGCERLLTLSRNWLVLGGAIAPGSAKAPDIKASEIQKVKRHDAFNLENITLNERSQTQKPHVV